MTRKFGTQLRSAFVPFHWPGRDRRFLAALPRSDRARYSRRLWLWWPWIALHVWTFGYAGATMACLFAFSPTGRAFHALVGGFALLTLLTGPIWWHLQMRRTRQLATRDHPTWCQTCGYDCRGTPDRCPECGMSHATSTAEKR